METCTLYSHYPDFDKVIDIVKKDFPKGRIKITDQGLQRSVNVVVRAGLFKAGKKLTINSRRRETPSLNLERINCDLSDNLAGMIGFVQNIPAKNKNIQALLINKIATVNMEMAFLAEPALDEDFVAILKKISDELDCIVFANPGTAISRATSQHLLDKHLRLIMDLEGNSEVENLEINIDSIHYDAPKEDYLPDQIDRKERSERLLREHSIKINEHLPCVVSEEQVNIRSDKELIDRIYALMIIAAKGEGVEQQYLDRAIKAKKIKSFSPDEKVLLEAKELSEQERANATWRYESLNALLWAAGTLKQLKFPSEICHVPDVIQPVFEPERADFEAKVQVRSPQEILDQLDQIYRMHWACVDARIKGEKVSGKLEPGVVYERHYALNWLTSYRNQDWDRVTTDT